VREFSADRLDALADRLGFAFGPDESEAALSAINAELPGYETLDALAAPRTHDDPVAGVTLLPGGDDDPLNAFVSRFSPPPTDGGPLDGLDVGVKDNIAVAGVPMTCGSRVFESTVPARHATVVRRLIDAGAAVVGKTNMDELAYGPTGETSGFGPTRNPADPDHVAGGSSSGSAAAVASGTLDAALGSDTGGSIRLPAAFCGVVGFKPSWGMVPRVGFVEMAYTLDHVGPFAPDVATAALVFDAVAGPDPGDPSSARAGRLDGTAAEAAADPPAVGELSVGLPAELFADHVDAAVADRVRAAADDLAAAGATVEEVRLPTVPDIVAVWNAITNAEFADTLRSRMVPVRRRAALDPAWQDAAAGALAERADDFGPVVRRKAVVGAHLLDRGAREYVRARAVADRLADEFAAALSGHDALLAPTTPTTAPAVGRWAAGSYSATGESYDVPLAFNTRPADVAGVPAVSLPVGEADGLPVGLQLIGPRDGDDALFGTAAVVEAQLG